MVKKNADNILLYVNFRQDTATEEKKAEEIVPRYNRNNQGHQQVVLDLLPVAFS